VTRDRAVLAVQGPQARQIAAEVLGADQLPKRFGVQPAIWRGVPCTIAGTGYTGESGLEVSVPAEAAAAVWAAFTEAGAEPAGLGARDTLRLEAALPRHGHELGPGITSLQAGLDWVVAWEKSSFLGREALQGERDRGVARRLYGIATSGRRPPRADCVLRYEGVAIGMVTSGNFSPVLGHGIALAFMPPGIAQGARVEIDLRGTVLPGTVVPTPFVGKR
jgi:aminomethyltransferase